MARLTPQDLEEMKASAEWQELSEEEKAQVVEAIEYDWDFYARDKQKTPPGDWSIWLIMAGRGWGKTRTGAEQVKKWALRKSPDTKGIEGPVMLALVSQTYRDGHNVMVEGESGLLNILPPSSLIRGSAELSWNKTSHRLTLADGSWFQIYSSETPGRLRGPQHHFAWGDEPAEWMDAGLGEMKSTTFSNLRFGLRLGSRPRVVLTGTPTRVRLIRELVYKDGDKTKGRRPGVYLTQGSLYENLDNLAENYHEIIEVYEGTSLGAQEIHGELLDDVEGALWTYDLIDRYRITPAAFEDARDEDRHDHPLRTLSAAIAIDPAVTANPKSDETGIVAGMLGSDRHVYVTHDLSGKYSPDEWATTAVRAYDAMQADRMIAEVNNGGDLVANNIKTFDKFIPIRQVRASKGKIVRAEPVQRAYQQGLVHHVGRFSHLEEQMTSWDGSKNAESPDRMDALVWLVTDLLKIGLKSRAKVRYTDTASPLLTSTSTSAPVDGVTRPSAEVVSAARKRRGRLRFRMVGSK